MAWWKGTDGGPDSSNRTIGVIANHDHDLLETVQSEIIPRLLLSHRDDAVVGTTCESRGLPTNDEIDEFAHLAVAQDIPTALARIQTYCTDGLSLEAILVHLIAPTARLLGDQWLSDERLFTEVTLGLGALQQLVFILGPRVADVPSNDGFVLLTAAPGEQHTLGLYIAGEFIRKAGYGVLVAPTMPSAELLEFVASESVGAVGFTVSNTHLLKPLASLIALVRRSSRNRRLEIVVGGALDLTEFAAQHDAVVCGTDPREFVRHLDVSGKLGTRSI